jgi:hypothetical protein
VQVPRWFILRRALDKENLHRGDRASCASRRNGWPPKNISQCRLLTANFRHAYFDEHITTRLKASAGAYFDGENGGTPAVDLP